MDSKDLVLEALFLRTQAEVKAAEANIACMLESTISIPDHTEMIEDVTVLFEKLEKAKALADTVAEYVAENAGFMGMECVIELDDDDDDDFETGSEQDLEEDGFI